MTPAEFKGWFEGFSEGMEGPPNEKQWGKIKEKVSQIDGIPISYPVFVGEYWPQIYPYWKDTQPYCGTWPTYAGNSQANRIAQAGVYNSQVAMYQAGKTEFAA